MLQIILLAFVLNISTSSSLQILAPLDGTELHGSKVLFELEAPDQENIDDDLMVCLQLTNKRLTYESYTHCVTKGYGKRNLDGFSPGVWRCLAYLREQKVNETDVVAYAARGAVREAINTTELWFVIDRERWEDELFAQAAPRAVALLTEISKKRTELKQIVRRASRYSFLLISMANAAHVSLAVNMVYSVRRTASDSIGTLIFALSRNALQALQSQGVDTTLISWSNDNDNSRPVQVQSRGFAAVALFKPVCVLVVLQSGYDALWIDTDIVFFRSPMILVNEAYSQAKSIVLQSGSLGPLGIARGEAHFHVEACTGIFLAKKESASLFEAAVQDLERMSDRGDTKVGDQAAINLALFEARFRRDIKTMTTFGVLDPLIYPAGGIFFQTNLSSTHAVLAHNNFILGHDNKLNRFKERGLWFSQSHDTNRYMIHRPPVPICTLNQVHIDQAKPIVIDSLDRVLYSVNPILNSTFLWTMDPVFCKRSKYALTLVSIGQRPWAQLLFQRIARYAKRLNADVLGLCRLPQLIDYSNEKFNVDSLAKRAKLILAAETLSLYERVLVLDDTVVVRRDTPDLFQIVPPLAIGATIEDDRIRPQSQSKKLLALAKLRHGYASSENDDQNSLFYWFNTGVLVLSWLHIPLLANPPPLDLDRLLFWDQGFLNAQVNAFRIPIYNLGYRFNFVGSFFTTNFDKAPFSAIDAYLIHGTTGLLMNLQSRSRFFSNISETWDTLNL